MTFYSHGSVLKSGLPGTHEDQFNGSIFDGAQGLVVFLDGFVARNNRFITLRLPAGEHALGAANSKKPRPDESITVTLKAGEHIFVRVQGSSIGVPVLFTVQRGRPEVVPCPVAIDEMAKATPLKEKALWRYTKAHEAEMVVWETKPSGCS